MHWDFVLHLFKSFPANRLHLFNLISLYILFKVKGVCFSLPVSSLFTVFLDGKQYKYCFIYIFSAARLYFYITVDEARVNEAWYESGETNNTNLEASQTLIYFYNEIVK